MRGTYDDFDAVVRPHGEPRANYRGRDGFVGHGVILRGDPIKLAGLIHAIANNPATSGLLATEPHIAPVDDGAIVAWRLSEFVDERNYDDDD